MRLFSRINILLICNMSSKLTVHLLNLNIYEHIPHYVDCSVSGCN